jgi:hypothetical protein
MTPHDWYTENLVAFVTKTLDAKEQQTFVDHVARCEDCRGAVAQLERDIAWLPMGMSPLAPRPGLTHVVLERVLRPHRIPWAQWIAAMAAAASLVFALQVWRLARHEIGGLRSALDARQGRLNAIQDTLSAVLGAERVLQETIKRPGYKGGVLIFYDQDTQRWNVVLHDLPPARRGETYQLWFLSGARRLLPGPRLDANGLRPTFFAMPAPGPSSDVIGAVLTVGPVSPTAGGSPPPGVELARLTF